jgi:hypothetical protein
LRHDKKRTRADCKRKSSSYPRHVRKSTEEAHEAKDFDS